MKRIELELVIQQTIQRSVGYIMPITESALNLDASALRFWSSRKCLVVSVYLKYVDAGGGLQR
jgi:uncharacterized membrane protein (UPF0136 family)